MQLTPQGYWFVLADRTEDGLPRMLARDIETSDEAVEVAEEWLGHGRYENIRVGEELFGTFLWRDGKYIEE